MQISNSNMLHILQNVTAATDWNNFVILHDGAMDSSVKKLSYLKLVTIYSLDLKNEMPSMKFLNWLAKLCKSTGLSFAQIVRLFLQR